MSSDISKDFAVSDGWTVSLLKVKASPVIALCKLIEINQSNNFSFTNDQVISQQSACTLKMLPVQN